MLLKRLEIVGFKSFANKTTFDFGAGIVGIVGPNGSGKSNVIDAFRWLLGEREAKNLRGGKVDDLIFAGTPKRARMSQASVSIVFDNSSGKLPLDYKEIIITRKIARNGSSEYFINDSHVRLKDVVDFFSKIKLGSKGLTIIGQGSADLFIKASPQERIMMIQEILGLREYELKKAESERKLKNTAINLEKVEAVMAEVLPRLRVLKRQTGKWERREELEKQLQTIDKDFYAFKIKKLNTQRQEIQTPLPQIEGELKTKKTHQAELEEHIAKLEKSSTSTQEMGDIQKRKKTFYEQKELLQRELFKIEARQEALQDIQKTHYTIVQAQTTLENVEQLLDQAQKQDDTTAVKKYIIQALDTIRALFAKPKKEQEKTDDSAKQKEYEAKLQAIEKDIAQCQQHEEDLAKSVGEFNEKFKDAFGALEKLKEEIKTLNDQKQRIAFEEEKIAYRIEDVRHQIESSGGIFEHYQQRAQSKDFTVHYTDDELENIEHTILKLRGELASIGDIDKALLDETREVETHYEFLKKESQDLNEATENLGVLIKDLEEKIQDEFQSAFKRINEEFNTFFRLMFGGGSAKMKILKKEIKVENEELSQEETKETPAQAIEEDAPKNVLHGIDIEVSIPQKKITSMEMLSGGERTLVSIAVLFALITISPPPFLVLDEVDSALDEKNSRRFSDLIKNYSQNTQFVVVTHNRVTMEVAHTLYGVTMDDAGVSKMLSLQLADAPAN